MTNRKEFADGWWSRRPTAGPFGLVPQVCVVPLDGNLGKNPLSYLAQN